MMILGGHRRGAGVGGLRVSRRKQHLQTDLRRHIPCCWLLPGWVAAGARWDELIVADRPTSEPMSCFPCEKPTPTGLIVGAFARSERQRCRSLDRFSASSTSVIRFPGSSCEANRSMPDVVVVYSLPTSQISGMLSDHVIRSVAEQWDLRRR